MNDNLWHLFGICNPSRQQLVSHKQFIVDEEQAMVIGDSNSEAWFSKTQMNHILTKVYQVFKK